MASKRKPTAEEAEKLAPFEDLTGKIPPERIAEMAGVPVEAVPTVASTVPDTPESGSIADGAKRSGCPEVIVDALRAAEANGWNYGDLTGTGEENDPTKGVSIRSGLTMAQMAVTPKPAEPTVDLEPVPDPDEFRDDDTEDEDDDDTGPAARAAAAPTVQSHHRHQHPVIMLKRSVNVDLVDPKGKITHATFPMSLYRGRMALRVMDAVDDPSLYDVIVPL